MSIGGETYRVMLVELLFIESLMENTEKQIQKMCADDWKGPSTASTVSYDTIKPTTKTQTPHLKSP